MLLVLAGATAYTLRREAIAFALNQPFTQLTLMAPALDFFRGPGALDGFDTPINLIGGARDRIVPPEAIHGFVAACPPVSRN
ncbi:hypothetical protein [Maritalea mediterranea]|uniref:Alpha/beta hydrolase n=1 Tax=Maritalea mediterranea TaxID=2909667 RepID=A0ABS9E282_9HYPH|nr:hypothetical protein [Maritalea mediterranea]MCF4096964.1 hypothetical protein [Maritalea mediterranea]